MTDRAGRFAKGTPLTQLRRPLNRLRDQVQRQAGEQGGSRQLSSPITGTSVIMVGLISDEGDYLACYQFDDHTSAQREINVAKPPQLQRTPFDGESQTIYGTTVSYTYSNNYTRSATDGSDSETQIILPQYNADDRLFVAELFAPMRLADGTFVRHVDLNVDARAWVQQPVA